LNKASLAQLANTTCPSLDTQSIVRGSDFEYHVNLVVRNDDELDRLIAVAKSEIDEDDNPLDNLRIANNEVFKELPYIVSGRLDLDQEFLFINEQGTTAVLDGLDGVNLTGGTLFLPESLNCVNVLGLFDTAGDGQGDVFSKVQDKIVRFVQVDEGFRNLDTDEIVFAETVKQLEKSVHVPDGSKAKTFFFERGLVYVRIMKKFSIKKMTVDAHLEKAQSHAENLGLILNLDDVNDLRDAALAHDDGKKHPLWQLAATGSTGAVALAKTGGSFYNPSLLAGMRHELVSALMNPELSDLARWLVVSHHGRCRPQFPTKAYDLDQPAASAELNSTLPKLLDKLNGIYGAWGLAYLEAVMRGVDINAE
jgi:hypothetical protein